MSVYNWINHQMTKIEDWFFKSRPGGNIQFPIKNRAERSWLAFVLAEIGVWVIRAVKNFN